jgi:hypothetical protein
MKEIEYKGRGERSTNGAKDFFTTEDTEVCAEEKRRAEII